MSTRTPNTDIVASLAQRNSSGSSQDTETSRTPTLSRTESFDAPQSPNGYFSKAIQSVLETLSPNEHKQESDTELQLLETAIEQARDAIVICEPPKEGTPPVVCYTNQSFATWTRVPRQEMEGQNLFDLPGWELAEGGRRRMLNALKDGNAYEGEMSGTRPQGGEYIVEVRFNPILKAGVCTHYIGIVRDVTSRKRIERELVHNANHDALTALPNRKLFRDRLDQALRRAQRYRDGVALLYIDLDGFKPINDSLGHQIGDLVLQTVSSRLLEVVRASDTVARLGGDEFVVLLPSCAEPSHAERVAQKIIHTVTQVIVGQGKEIFITASIGVAHFCNETPEPDHLIQCADMAMYQAKAEGKAKFVRYTEALRSTQQTQNIMANELANAIAKKEFQLHYRPVFQTKTSQYSGAEPMLRWLHPERGMVSPARFLPQLAKLPIEEAVAQWMLETACTLASKWPKDKNVFFTAFKSQLESRTLADTLLATLEKIPLKPQRLVFQIAESHLTTLSEGMLFQLVKLQAGGVRIIISQYGTSNLSLPQMRNLPINGLKIDPTLTGRLETNGQLIRGITALSKSLGLTIMADGVATAKQLNTLAKLGCEACQGLHIGTPKPDIQF